jgi:hypothetical protein
MDINSIVYKNVAHKTVKCTCGSLFRHLKNEKKCWQCEIIAKHPDIEQILGKNWRKKFKPEGGNK